MNVLNLYTSIINSGISDKYNHVFIDRLKNRNKLSFLCVIFAVGYLLFFLKQSLILPFLGIILAILLFILSIIMNRQRRYNVSGMLIIVNTNYCVLFFSIYLGFASGIHLYLLTSPLIVMSAFDTKKRKAIILALSSYFLNYILIMVIGLGFNYSVLQIPDHQDHVLYGINFSCCLLILISLSWFFFKNNNRYTSMLLNKNKELAIENRIRKEAEKRANDASAECAVLLSEIHHRVKNNLAVVSGLLEVHTMNVLDPGILKVVKQCQNRIKSIAILHEKLYLDENIKEINMHDYLFQLIEHIDISFSATEQQIVFKTQIHNVCLEMAKAMPFGLLLNELLTNSYKHAFKNKTQGVITISLKKNGKYYELIYKDNGSGFTPENNSLKPSLGLTLIETFSKQLNGKYEFLPLPQGMGYQITFS